MAIEQEQVRCRIECAASRRIEAPYRWDAFAREARSAQAFYMSLAREKHATREGGGKRPEEPRPPR